MTGERREGTPLPEEGASAVEIGLRRVPPPPPVPESDPILVAQLRDEIRRGGPIPFARFMAIALHDPERGYYAAASPRPGRSGDFLTAPEAHPIFGATLGRAAATAWRTLGAPDPFTVVEAGAGSGALALGLLDGIRRDAPDCYVALRYEPDEAAAPRLAELRARLAAAGHGERLVGPSATPITGLVLANELLDALPVHRVTVEDGRLRELLVDWHEAAGTFVDRPAEPTTPALAARLVAEGVVLAEGQRAELCLALDDWVAAAAARLARGYLVAIDYGHPSTDLYGASRREGTLRTYLHHQVAADPYRAIGRQDLTAHVDLTALVRAAEAAGLRHLGTTTQAAFLAGSGIGELLAAAGADPGTTLGAALELRSALARLLDPGATGGFAVVAFGRDAPVEGLPGLAFRGPGR